jgi:hypothetical protein
MEKSRLLWQPTVEPNLRELNIKLFDINKGTFKKVYVGVLYA